MRAGTVEAGVGWRRPSSLPWWVRAAAALWLVVWFPAYAVVWGWANFLHLSDIAVILACAGFVFCSTLLLSSQAVSSIVVDVAWTLDVLWRLALGGHLIGGTEYMWDPRHPLWVRLLSLFHVAMPVLLLWSLHRLGYDRRALLLQSGIAAAALTAARQVAPDQNINYAFQDPFFHRGWGPPPVHLAIIFSVLVIAVYWPTHWVLAKIFPAPGATAAKG